MPSDAAALPLPQNDNEIVGLSNAAVETSKQSDVLNVLLKELQELRSSLVRLQDDVGGIKAELHSLRPASIDRATDNDLSSRRDFDPSRVRLTTK